jgi:hypothetical protein
LVRIDFYAVGWVLATDVERIRHGRARSIRARGRL